MRTEARRLDAFVARSKRDFFSSDKMLRMLILAAILAIFVYGLVAPMLGALLPSYNLTGAQNGSLGLLYALGLIVATLISGPVIDIKGKKIALAVGLALVALSLYWAPNAGGYGGLLGVYFLLGWAEEQW